jgi:hypothetical protein
MDSEEPDVAASEEVIAEEDAADVAAAGAELDPLAAGFELLHAVTSRAATAAPAISAVDLRRLMPRGDVRIQVSP